MARRKACTGSAASAQGGSETHGPPRKAGEWSAAHCSLSPTWPPLPVSVTRNVRVPAPTVAVHVNVTPDFCRIWGGI